PECRIDSQLDVGRWILDVATSDIRPPTSLKLPDATVDSNRMQEATPPELDPTSRGITPAQRIDALQYVNRRRSLGLGFLWEWTKIFWISVALFLVLRTFIVEAFKIPSGSMERTLLIGDFLLVNKLAYGAEIPFTHKRLPAFREPQRGDVMVFEAPEDITKTYVKRLVGLPGDTLEM